MSLEVYSRQSKAFQYDGYKINSEMREHINAEKSSSNVHKDRDTVNFSAEGRNMCYGFGVHDVKDRAKHTVVKPGIAPLFDTISRTLKTVREEMGSYDYSDIANACGYAYAKCFSEIEKKYVNSQDKYYNLDGTPCTKKQEIAWLDEAYEEKINWETANVRIAAGREQFLGHIPDISQKDIEEYEENIKNAKEQYIKQYQEKGTVKLQHLSFGQSSLLQKLSELMNM